MDQIKKALLKKTLYTDISWKKGLSLVKTSAAKQYNRMISVCRPVFSEGFGRMMDQKTRLEMLRSNNVITLKQLYMKFFSKEESYISKNMTLYGDLETDTDITVHGTIYGNIRSKRNVTLGATARVEGNIESDTVAVSGHFKGVISAKRLIEVKIPANINGDLIADSVRVAPGVAINGKIQAQKVDENVQNKELMAEEGTMGGVVREYAVIEEK